tara:strand:- start:59 stop:295 length:237 start_codon:yes stop_codon:yes gene_type:complete
LSVAKNDNHTQPQRIALFSLGNLCVYSTCRDSLLAAAEVGSDMLDILDSLERETKDKTVVKYIQRIRNKLKAPVFKKR